LPADSASLGRWGEEEAARFVRREHHYKVLYRNFRAPRGGEVDLVCRDRREQTLVFIEIKTRRSDLYGRPGAAVNQEKQRLIIRGAMAWLRLLDNPDIPFRFDVVEIIATPEPRANLIQNAFQLPDGMIY